ncbi:MAG: hypothetical protein ACTHN2_11585 [Nitrobacter sp.]|jgi:hypothetical protein
MAAVRKAGGPAFRCVGSILERRQCAQSPQRKRNRGPAEIAATEIGGNHALERPQMGAAGPSKALAQSQVMSNHRDNLSLI